MDVSAFSVVDDDPAFGSAGRDRYRELLDLAPELEAAGFHALWVAEHHFHAGGVLPSPPVFLAAAGERTRRLRLGVMVSVLPFHAPVRLAEEYALLDRLTGGRLNLGVGSGYLAREFEGFGVDPAGKRALFDRHLDLFLAGLRGEELPAGTPGAAPLRLNVRPVQRPHPPLWVAVQRREAIPFVAERGANLGLVPYATLASVAELRAEVEEYRRARRDGARGRVSAAIPVYAGPHPERARAALQRYLDSRLATQSTFYREKVRQHPEAAQVATLEQTGLVVLGTPEEVRTRLTDLERAGVDELLAILDFGGLPAEEVRASARNLAAELTRGAR